MTLLNKALKQKLEHLSKRIDNANDIHKIFMDAAQRNDYDLVVYMTNAPSLQRFLQDRNSIRYGFHEAALYGRLDVLRYLVQRSEVKDNNLSYHVSRAFTMACTLGNMDIIRYVLTSPELPEHADIHYRDNEGLHNACANGHLEVVQYLLTSPELTKHADIRANEEYALRSASKNNHLPILSYLLTSPDLKQNADIHTLDDNILQEAVYHNRLKTVEFLLSSPDLKEHANIHAQNDAPYRYACEKNHTSIIHYLLDFQVINFQNTKFNLDWALNLADTTIIQKMVHYLQHDPIEHWKALSDFKNWCHFYGKEDFYHETTHQSKDTYTEIALTF